MARYVAFLRAVNVGKRQVAMQRLRTEFEAMGFDDVSTYINSGNVVFSSSDKPATVEPAIEARLEKAFGFEIVTFVRTANAVKKVAGAEPFDVKAGTTHMVAFLRKRPNAAATKAIEALSMPSDKLVVVGSEIHWLIRGGFSDSKLKAKTVVDAAGGPNTTRNMTMLRKLAGKLG